jgi:hypothetical protein
MQKECSTNLLFMGLMRHCVGTIVGGITICFCWIKGFEVAVIVAVFCASFEQTVKRLNFAV